VIGDGDAGTAADAVAWTHEQLLDWHHQFSRFEPDSELARLNGDRSEVVEVSPVMAMLAQLVVRAYVLTDGLVDGTMAGQIERAGYTEDLGDPVPLEQALADAPPRKAAAGDPESGARSLEVDLGANTISRPPGVRLDSGGLAKGLFCDLVAAVLETHPAFAIDCAGDVRIGGRDGIEREVRVGSPFGPDVLHVEKSAAIAAATSGIGRRSWRDVDGKPAHHLLDPSTGLPAFTGLVQATAFAPTAALAEVCAKAALLSGPELARMWLPDGGVLVFDDGDHEVAGASGRTEFSAF
jgi:thiamine biosynthesis lipoprotein